MTMAGVLPGQSPMADQHIKKVDLTPPLLCIL